MRFFSRKTVVRGVAALSIAAALVGAGVFVGASTASAAQTVMVASGDANTLFITEDAASSYASTSWTNVASQYFNHNVGQPRYIRIRFTAESYCTGNSGWCSIRLLVNGTEAKPVVGTDFAFDSASTDGYESHSVERIFDGSFGSGNTITVQAATVGGASFFRLDDWVLEADVLY
jgi:hypothetical protein